MFLKQMLLGLMMVSFCWLVSASPAGSQTITITFNFGTGRPLSYTESGLTVTSLQDHLHLNFFNTSTVLFNHPFIGSTPYLFDVGGAPFTVVSVDLIGNGAGTFTSSAGAVVQHSRFQKGTFTFPTTGWQGITSFRWDVTSDNKGIDNLVILTAAAPIEVAIDIKPGSDPNSINLGSAGVIPVAILSSATFDATTVDPDTIFLASAPVKVAGKSGKLQCHSEDVNDDMLVDLVCQVETALSMIETGQGTAELTALTTDGIAIVGEDTINIVP